MANFEAIANIEVLINEVVAEKELREWENKYYQETKTNNIKLETQFNYSWCLIRSSNLPDTKQGIKLLEELSKTNPKENQDYFYYLTIGNARVKEYEEALKYCNLFLKYEPKNKDALALQDYIGKKKFGGMAKIAVAFGGAALAVVGIVGLIGYALSSSSSSNQDDDMYDEDD